MTKTLRLNLTVSNEAAGVFGHTERLMLERRAGESGAHVAMKLLAYGLFYSEGLCIERAVGGPHKPDLVRVDARGRPVQWIECGQVAAEKIEALLRRYPDLAVDVVKGDQGTLGRWAASVGRRLSAPHRVRAWAFGPGLVEPLCDRLADGDAVTMTVDEAMGQVWLDHRGETLSASVHRALGAVSARRVGGRWLP